MWTPSSSKKRLDEHSKKKHHVHNHSLGKKSKEDQLDVLNVKYPKTGIGSNVSNCKFFSE